MAMAGDEAPCVTDTADDEVVGDDRDVPEVLNNPDSEDEGIFQVTRIPANGSMGDDEDDTQPNIAISPMLPPK